ncbi:TetR family transcriptional regulator [Egibacter rhizosphaerae]|uniref:TetR family transcriptional regulator n=1 Tax=Egibacter rhizosphaerae TaxID=1670831 RepID=A0A411YFJ4_9ACTN|nr:TetR family transcriptional regulator [Egibacter rhizosphaerae]QBI19892.1 TetR family transcriptional regulator [Egibacter rhizosphaerae]
MAKTGLRERKRLAAMRRIQETAFELFERDGYDAVTIEQIADQAEVSPSSVYRYFGTKERVVLWDEYDPPAFERFAAELREHPPLEAMRLAIDLVGAQFLGPDRARVERTTRLAFEEPAVTAAMRQELDAAAEAIAELVADARAMHRDDLAVQVFARAVVAAIEAALRTWHAGGFEASLVDLLHDALGALEGGLDLR